MPKQQPAPDDDLKAEPPQTEDAAAPFDPMDCGDEPEQSGQSVGMGLPMADAEYDALKEKAAKPSRAIDPQPDQSNDDDP